ncbi:MAG: helix-turn-helix domain-containing protein [Thermodesulfobacteriota bacterium]|nr:helix-turn-helix domain-containing protein [Thermodesulfobacteriota bacterium]
MQQQFVVDKEVARAFCLNLGTLRNYRSKNQGPPFYRIGGRILYSLDEVRQWFQANRVEPKGDRCS